MQQTRQVTLYSNGCPSCKVVKSILDKNNIEYDQVSNMEDIMVIAQREGIRSLPFADIDGEFVAGTEIMGIIKGD